MDLSGSESDRERGSVLVVDDEEGARQALRHLLSPQFDVHLAESGEAALEFVRDRAVDVVTLDLHMPGLSGLETLSKIRGFRPNLEVIIVTGVGSFDTAVHSLRLHAFDFLSKPFNAADVLDVVERAREAKRHAPTRATAPTAPEAAAEMAGHLAELEAGEICKESPDVRLLVDHARLLASAIRDHIDSAPERRVRGLIEIAERLSRETRWSDDHDRRLVDRVALLGRSLRSTLSEQG